MEQQTSKYYQQFRTQQYDLLQVLNFLKFQILHHRIQPSAKLNGTKKDQISHFKANLQLNRLLLTATFSLTASIKVYQNECTIPFRALFLLQLYIPFQTF